MPAGIISLDVVGAAEKGSRWLYASRLFPLSVSFLDTLLKSIDKIIWWCYNPLN